MTVDPPRRGQIWLCECDVRHLPRQLPDLTSSINLRRTGRAVKAAGRFARRVLAVLYTCRGGCLRSAQMPIRGGVEDGDGRSGGEAQTHVQLSAGGRGGGRGGRDRGTALGGHAESPRP